MNINKDKTVCFTGHRPEKMPFAPSDTVRLRTLKSLIYSEITSAIDRGFDTFITGMQRGVDLWAAEAVMELSARHKLSLIAALPYKDMGKGFKGQDKWVFGRILNRADETVIISDDYTPGCMNKRNRFMVDNSSLLIAVVGDMRSGTGQTVRYAEKSGIEICRIDLCGLFPDENQLTLL